MIPKLDHRAPTRHQLQSLDIGPAPELTFGQLPHWVEQYWVKHKDFWYYRYCWMEGRKIRRCHIPGGNVSSGAARRRADFIKLAIRVGDNPMKIQQRIQSWRPKRNAHANRTLP